MRLSCKKCRGPSSPDDKLTGDLGNVIEATQIVGRRVGSSYGVKIITGQFWTFATISARTRPAYRIGKHLDIEVKRTHCGVNFTRSVPPFKLSLIRPRAGAMCIAVCLGKTDSIMLTLVLLITISLFSYVGLAEPVAAQSSAMQNSMSSVFLEELLRELHVDEIIDTAEGSASSRAEPWLEPTTASKWA
jgi:hypothetical protein